MKEKKICPHCKRSMEPNKQGLTRGLVMTLLSVYDQVGTKPFHLQKDVALTKNQYNNFQKLRYWGLVKKCADGGVWQIDRVGIEFLKDNVRLRKFLYTFNNAIVGDEGDFVKITDVLKDEDLPYYQQQFKFPKDVPSKQMEMAI